MNRNEFSEAFKRPTNKSRPTLSYEGIEYRLFVIILQPVEADMREVLPLYSLRLLRAHTDMFPAAGAQERPQGIGAELNLNPKK